MKIIDIILYSIITITLIVLTVGYIELLFWLTFCFIGG